MKKSLRFLMVAAAVAGFSLQANADLYIIGDVVGGGWTPNNGIEMNETSTGVYEATVTINSEFCLATQLGADSEDWNGLNANRYGGISAKYLLNSGVETDLMKYPGWDNNFMVVAGEYALKVDMNKMTIVATSTAPIEYPDKMYIAGALQGITAWEPSEGIEMPEKEGENGVYTATVTVVGGGGAGVASFGYVGFTSQLSETPGDWTAFNSGRYGASAYNQAVAPEVAYMLQPLGQNSFGVAEGEYDVTLNLAENTVTFVPTGTIEYSFPENLYLTGNVDGASGWIVDNGLAIPMVAGTLGLYTATITITADTDGYFAISAAINNEDEAVADNAWEIFNSRQYIPAGATDVLTLGEPAEMVMSGSKSFTITPGTYDIKVQLSSIAAGTVTMLEQGTSGVDGVEVAVEARPVAGDGRIVIAGDADNVEVYNIGGCVVAKGNLTEVTCPQGVYIVRIDGKSHKVVVK